MGYANSHAAAFQPDAATEIELRLGGYFQTTFYRLSTEGVLAYDYSDITGEVRKTAQLSSAQRDDFARLMRDFDPRTMRSDRPAGPDATYYQLKVSQMSQQFSFYCWSQENACYKFADRLKGLFGTVLGPVK